MLASSDRSYARGSRPRELRWIARIASRAAWSGRSTKASAFSEACKRRSLLVGKGGLYGNTVRIAPPMLVDEAQIDHACDVMDQAMAEISA